MKKKKLKYSPNKDLKYVMILLLVLCLARDGWSQPCVGAPSYTINLTGRPDSTWTSPNVTRSGDCCGSSSPDRCIEFILTLDSQSSGIKLDIPTGALPGGALFYQIGCGTSYQVGTEICLSGPGPHRITFCKPGNNDNTYQIKAIPKPNVTGKLLITEACIGNLKAVGLVTSSITWQSVPNNATHNSYLSCLTGCDSVSIIPTGSYPPTVTYRVCGQVLGGCGGATFCDTATVRFVTNTSVNILPKDAAVCFGGATTSITANPVGGLAPFHFNWNTGDTTQSINVTPGTYYVSMTDSLGCSIVRDTVTVTGFALPIDASAGNDTTVCTRLNSIVLNGVVQSASGGKWLGGTGSFIPNDTTLNATYYPSLAETLAGSVRIKLLTTGNKTCPADTDTVDITIVQSPAPAITGPSTVCEYKTTSYSVAAVSGNTYVWTVNGGIIQGSATDTFVNVKWGATGIGSVTLKQTNTQNCDSTVSKIIGINSTPAPVLAGPSAVCEHKTTTYSVAAASGNSYAWTVTGGIIQGSATDTFVNVKWGVTGTGSVTLKQTNAQDCDSTVSKIISINSTPAPVLSGPSTVCEHKTTTYSVAAASGNSYAWTVTGGTIQGNATDTFVDVKWGVTGTGSITLKQTNTQNCDSTVSKIISINSTPAPVLSGPSTVCEEKITTYSVAAASGNSYVWTVTGGIIQGNTSDTLIQVKWGVTGLGSITLKQTNAQSCDSTVSKIITISPTPAPVLSGPSTVCEHKTTTYSVAAASGNSYAWIVTGGTIQGNTTDTFVDVKWGVTGMGSVTLKQTNAQNCDSTVVRIITINPTPVPVITGPDSSCAYKIKQYTTPFNSGNSYKWQITGGTILGIDTLPQITVTWSNSIITNLSLTVTNSGGCDSTIVKNIIVTYAPVASVNGDTLVCSMTKYTYTSATISGVTYKWSVLSGIITDSSFDTSIQVVWGNGTSGIVRLLVSNAEGCDSSVDVNVRIVPKVQSAITGQDTVCERKVQRYSVNKIIGHTYQWSAPGGLIQGSSTDTSVQIVWNNPGTKTVSLLERSEADCDSTITLTVRVEPTPIPTITGPSSICAFNRAVYSAPFKIADTYEWQVTGGVIENILSDTQISVLWGGGPIAGAVKLKQTNSEGCDSTVVLPVSIKSTPDPVIFGSTTVCANRLITYSTNFLAGNSYQWTVLGGTLLPVNDTFIQVRWGNNVSGSVALRVVSSLLCDSSRILNIEINPVPQEDITGPLTVCAHSQATYSVVSKAGYVYSWSVTGGIILGTSTTNSIDVFWGQEGTGSVRLTQFSDKGCDSLFVKTVQLKSRPIPKIIGPNITCVGLTQYQYSSSLSDSKYKYNWTVESGNIQTGAGTPQIVVTWSATGTYKISLRVTDTLTLCDSITTFNVLVDSIQKPVLDADRLAGCVPLMITFTGNQLIPGYNYFWDFGNGTFSTERNPQYVFTTPGVYDVKVRVSNANGCSDSVVSKVSVSAIPVPNFTYTYQNERIYAGEDTVIFNNKSLGGNAYFWELSYDYTDTAVNPKNIYKGPGFYTVKLVTIDTTTGCEKSIEKRLEVRVRERMLIPNAFTPDGDNINDYFRVALVNLVEFDILIFDRWGTILYRSNDPYFKWDGKYEGEPLPADVYGFLARGKGYHGKEFNEYGTVTLIR